MALGSTDRSSDFLYADAARMIGKCGEIAKVRGQHGSTGLSECDSKGIDGGASPGSSSNCGRPPRQHFRNIFHDIAGFQEAVRERVPPGMSFQTLDEDD